MFNWRKPIIYALLYLSGSKIPHNLKEIKRLEKLSLKEKKQYQEEKLKKILFYAYKNVPYYKKVLGKAKVVKNGIVFLENFNKIPILTVTVHGQ
jgi:phenylacetate-coenzyme A ligase PaaK-like adenylate-forming protein